MGTVSGRTTLISAPTVHFGIVIEGLFPKRKALTESSEDDARRGLGAPTAQCSQLSSRAVGAQAGRSRRRGDWTQYLHTPTAGLRLLPGADYPGSQCVSRRCGHSVPCAWYLPDFSVATSAVQYVIPSTEHPPLRPLNIRRQLINCPWTSSLP